MRNSSLFCRTLILPNARNARKNARPSEWILPAISCDLIGLALFGMGIFCAGLKCTLYPAQLVVFLPYRIYIPLKIYIRFKYPTKKMHAKGKSQASIPACYFQIAKRSGKQISWEWCIAMDQNGLEMDVAGQSCGWGVRAFSQKLYMLSWPSKNQSIANQWQTPLIIAHWDSTSS